MAGHILINNTDSWLRYVAVSNLSKDFVSHFHQHFAICTFAGHADGSMGSYAGGSRSWPCSSCGVYFGIVLQTSTTG